MPKITTIYNVKQIKCNKGKQEVPANYLYKSRELDLKNKNKESLKKHSKKYKTIKCVGSLQVVLK